MASDCIFCKIIKGQIPCTKVYEDADVFVFLDINPINKGHTLVVPKHHSENLYTIPEKDLLAYVQLETMNWLKRVVTEEADKYVILAVWNFVNCIAFVSMKKPSPAR